MKKRLICSLQNSAEGYDIDVFERMDNCGYVAEVVTYEQDWGTGNRLGVVSRDTKEISEEYADRIVSRLNSMVNLSGSDYSKLCEKLHV